MKVGKATGPSGVTSDLTKAAGATGVNRIFQACESSEKEGKFPEYLVGQELYHTHI